jgi:NAD(P)-dependent dehydrogenase (short-subunit alcohol dehydrogenase family)
MIHSIKDAFSLKGKVVLVTGGNQGIGKGISQAMAESGADVAIMCRSRESAENTIRELEHNGGTYRFYAGDVTSQKDAKETVEQVVKEFGRLDILVNNAGIATPFDAMEDTEDLSGWYRVLDVDLNGTFLMCHYAGLQMKKQGYGRIINITSNSSRIVNIPQKSCSYNAAKAAADRLTKCLAYEWAKYGIRVNAIAPGYTETNLVTGVEDAGETKGWTDYWLSCTPTGRFGKPIEIGAAAVFLASEAAEQITGAVLTVDGGYMLAR